MNTPGPGADKYTGLSVTLTSLGRVRLTRALAHNVATSVYQTDHPGVAVKVFDLSCGKSDEIGYGPYVDFQAELANFEEILALESLRNFVPTYYGAHIDYENKHAVIAMEHLEGENLRAWSGQWTAGGYTAEVLDEFRRTIHEVLSIVDLFHRFGFVLIDFKPDNVIRLPTGSVKLVDLGACFTPRSRRDLRSFVYAATPDHAEVVIDASNLQAGVPPSVSSDVFSAGVALFEMATGQSRLAIDPQAADEMLAMPAVYRFRDSQIADVWRAFPHLKPELPLVQTQLRERRILFSELWHLLKAYLAAKAPDWDTLPHAQQDQVLLSTGTTFIQEQLPAPLAWLGGAIGRATVLRSLRFKSIGELLDLIGSPVSDEVLADVTQHNGFLKCARELELWPATVRLNAWEVRYDPASSHWAIAAPLASRQLGENAAFIFLKRLSTDEEGHSYWQVVDEFDADRVGGTMANLGQLQNDHRSWLR